MALGAQRRNVLWLVLREVLLLALGGIAGGIPLAMWTNGYAKALLFGVDTTDPLTFVASAAALLLVAMLAGIIPTRRAMRIDPMIALRYE